MNLGRNAGFVYEGVSNCIPVLDIDMRLTGCKKLVTARYVFLLLTSPIEFCCARSTPYFYGIYPCSLFAKSFTQTNEDTVISVISSYALCVSQCSSKLQAVLPMKVRVLLMQTMKEFGEGG